MDFSLIVRLRMAELGMNASELARLMGYSPQYINDLINRKKGRWNEETMNKACQALNLKIDFNRN